MTIKVRIDGEPLLVEFTGTIEIARSFDGETALFRRLSGDGPMRVYPDAEAKAKQRSLLDRINEAYHSSNWVAAEFVRDTTRPYPSLAKSVPSQVRDINVGGYIYGRLCSSCSS